jgi:O-antigen ligase
MFIFLSPELGVMSGTHQGSWRGIFAHKNLFGRTMDLAVVIFVLLALGRQGRSWLWWGLAAVAAAMVFRSNSAGALIVGAVMVALLPFARIMQRSRTLIAPALILILVGAGAVAVVTYADFTTVLGALGKDETLTGRTYLWSYTIDLGWERPWLGHGYDGFWLGWEGPSAAVWAAFEWLPPHAHNGVIDLWLDLGFVGVAIFAISVIYAVRSAVSVARDDGSWVQLWPFMFLVFLTLTNASESTIFQANDLLWVLYVSTTSSLGLHRLRARDRIADPLRRPTTEGMKGLQHAPGSAGRYLP